MNYSGNLVRQATIEDLPRINELVREAYQKYLPRMNKAPAPLLQDYEQLVRQGKV
ncbi:MAG: hypothetical protein JRN52_12085 [Nitrososphaerota archaeon]|nr:hypothetical protein [Nitrososphaerota archaeon]